MAVYKPKRDSLELLDRLLDKGLVIDGWRDLSLAGLKLGAVDQQWTAASIETSLRYGEAAGLLKLSNPARARRRAAQKQSRRSRKRYSKK
jgi:hypothetical protein